LFSFGICKADHSFQAKRNVFFNLMWKYIQYKKDKYWNTTI